MEFVNLTPHIVRLFAADGATIVAEIAPSGTVARVTTTPGALEDRGLPVPVAGLAQIGAIHDLPDPVPGVVYITALYVAQQAKRVDVLSPGTGPQDGAIRENGQVVGVTRLIAHV